MRVTLGIDVGGTKIAAGLVDPTTGSLIHERRIDTRAEAGPAALSDELAALAARLSDQASRQGLTLDGTGIALPEIVSAEGEIRSHALTDWTAVDLAGALGPHVVGADIRAAALAEARFGAGRGVRDFLFVAIGTGISCALVREGVPVVGRHGGALVLASAPFALPLRDGIEADVVIEEIAGGRAIGRAFGKASGWPGADAEMALAAANAGDPVAQSLFREAARLLGSAIALVLNVTDPDALVIGGGLGSAGGFYAMRLEEQIRSRLWGPLDAIDISRATLGAKAGVIGAGLIADAHKALLK